jgi:ectoine hydroxylase-related dioxygenase (phytanoyl-CoA dioxygenase family)
VFKPLELLDVVDKIYQNEIYNLVTDIKFPWHFLEDTTYENQRPDDVNKTTPAFVNLIYHQNNENNPYADKFTPLINAIIEKSNMELFSTIRVRMGFLLNTKYSHVGAPYKHNTPHVDGDIDHWTAIYYVNDCDGQTIVFRETEKSEKYYPLHRSDPKQGKVLLFNGRHYHASTCPKIYNKRIACTINFTGKFKDA